MFTFEIYISSHGAVRETFDETVHLFTDIYSRMMMMVNLGFGSSVLEHPEFLGFLRVGTFDLDELGTYSALEALPKHRLAPHPPGPP